MFTEEPFLSRFPFLFLNQIHSYQESVELVILLYLTAIVLYCFKNQI